MNLQEILSLANAAVTTCELKKSAEPSTCTLKVGSVFRVDCVTEAASSDETLQETSWT